MTVIVLVGGLTVGIRGLGTMPRALFLIIALRIPGLLAAGSFLAGDCLLSPVGDYLSDTGGCRPTGDCLRAIAVCGECLAD